ncbi:MAG TPA: 2-phospho-L-lactate guanylyltransferase [Actinomycetota bacterium]|nr:2-phospho-L-lactate guanylyltransferase [Actinomycetota bacterium]
MDAVLVPVKHLDASKLRLDPALGAWGRRRLALAMLGDVLRAAAPWPMRVLVTPDAVVADVARTAGWQVLHDPGRGLNAALWAGTALAVEQGASALAVLPFDVPLVSPADLEALFAARASVVVVPSEDGGTGALLRRPAQVIATRFGEASAAAHTAAAQAAGVAVETLHLAGLALDIDDLDDLRRLAASPSEAASARVARELLSAGAPPG